MRIIILSDAYLPESTLVHAKMLHDLAVEYSSRGHEVVVLTPGTISQQSRVKRDILQGVEVWRFRSPPTRGISHYKRAINETLLPLYAYRAIKSLSLNAKFDVCINYSPTIFFGPLCYWFRRGGTFVYLILRDFFPQWVIDEGLIKKRSLAAHYFRFFESLNYSAADVIGVQSPANKAIFSKMSASRFHPLETLYNWVGPPPDANTEFAEHFFASCGIKGKFIFFYGGNIGFAQDVPVILKLAEALSYREDVHFLLVGQGDQYNSIKRTISEMALANVTLSPSVSQQDYYSLLSYVDCGIFTLAASHTAHNFPGKILGYMSAGLPILGSVNPGNDVIDVLNSSGAGQVSVNGDFEAFKSNAMDILESPELRKRMSIQARGLLRKQFSVEKAADQILESFRATRVE